MKLKSAMTAISVLVLTAGLAGAKPVTIKGKELRVPERQADGTCKFARVMSLTDSHPAG